MEWGGFPARDVQRGSFDPKADPIAFGKAIRIGSLKKFVKLFSSTFHSINNRVTIALEMN